MMMMIANGFPECYIDDIGLDDDSERKPERLLMKMYPDKQRFDDDDSKRISRMLF